MNRFIGKLTVAAFVTALAGAAGSVEAQTSEKPRTNDTWYNTYADDAIKRAAQPETIIIIEERGLYAPVRFYGHKRKKHFKKYRDRRHDRVKRHREFRRHGPVVRHGRRGVVYNPRAAMLRAGVGR